ncbi:metallophosphoesterase family protein [Paenibacillus odorifer]|uniref:metallophosphoesterase family protein n=1 Tax=Paenibacillus odorifer TaxID=189426 RepID=UPI00096EA16A|nr:serine/threonine protein phosphatase [Paenibacillus odorifer]
MRTLVISDIHGCHDEFNSLLKKVKYEPTEDKLILLGDYIDRGLKSKQVVDQVMRMVKENDVVALKGNHDQMGVDALSKADDQYSAHWIRNGAITTLTSYCGAEIFEEGFDWDAYDKTKEYIVDNYKHHLDFLSSLPLYLETDEHIFVHAGINPLLKDWKKTKEEDFYWIRDLFYSQANGNTEKTVVFGHTPVVNIHDSADIWFSPHGDKIGIDGACAYGKQLNCLEISEEGYQNHCVRKGEWYH